MVLLYDPLLIDNGAIVADAFQCHQVTLGDIGSIKLNAGFTIGIRRDFRIPIKRGAMVRTRLARLVGVLWIKEINGQTVARLMHGDHGQAVF